MTTSEPKQKHKYKLRFHPAAWEEWNALDGSVKKPLKKLLAKRLDNPHVPGGALTDDLLGCYKIKLNKQGVRLVYRVQDDVPLGQIKGEYEVDPIKDLIPVCANCHAMIHSTRPALEVDQLRQYLIEHKAKSRG